PLEVSNINNTIGTLEGTIYRQPLLVSLEVPYRQTRYWYPWRYQISTNTTCTLGGTIYRQTQLVPLEVPDIDNTI
ncbi:46080_t:CDS:2, partial [Gigaspora margarita]